MSQQPPQHKRQHSAGRQCRVQHLKRNVGQHTTQQAPNAFRYVCAVRAQPFYVAPNAHAKMARRRNTQPTARHKVQPGEIHAR